MKKTLSSLKVDSLTIENMKAAVEKHNKNSLVPVTENQFRRASYELLSQLILQEIEIPIQLQL